MNTNLEIERELSILYELVPEEQVKLELEALNKELLFYREKNIPNMGDSERKRSAHGIPQIHLKNRIISQLHFPYSCSAHLFISAWL